MKLFDYQPFDFADLMEYGGLQKLEREAAHAAAREAVRHVQREWLPIFERDYAEYAEKVRDPKTTKRNRQTLILGMAAMAVEIKRMRRCLGIAPTADERRAQTRERVRRHRERRRQQEPS